MIVKRLRSPRWIGALLVSTALLSAGSSDSAFADHELGPAPHVQARESDEKVTVTLSPGCVYSYIDFRVEDWTAEAGKDYVRVSGRLLSAPWSFDIPILEDGDPEPDEVARIIISGPSTGAPPSGGGSCVGHNQSKTGTLTILKNDHNAAPPGTTNSSPERPTAAEGALQGPAPTSDSSQPQPLNDETNSRSSTGRDPLGLGVTDGAQPAGRDLQQRQSPALGPAIIACLLVVVMAVWVLRSRRPVIVWRRPGASFKRRQ